MVEGLCVVEGSWIFCALRRLVVILGIWGYRTFVFTTTRRLDTSLRGDILTVASWRHIDSALCADFGRLGVPKAPGWDRGLLLSFRTGLWRPNSGVLAQYGPFVAFLAPKWRFLGGLGGLTFLLRCFLDPYLTPFFTPFFPIF